MASFPDGVGPGLFLPTTEIIDTQFISDDPKINNQLKEILIRIVQAFNDNNVATNYKDTGIYPLEEFVNGQVFFSNPALSSSTSQRPVLRQVFRSVVNFGSLPNSTSKSVAHGLTFDANTTFTRLYGAASDTTAIQYISIPTTIITSGGNIDLVVDSTNVDIETTFNATNYNVCYVVLEYIKQ